ncbi:hypothetical protein E2C01_086293 [Portunus trituberculatus]|uniref:Uncharacterized protein n=1 Tax=Portunus trituberculatus TaxID=210409 RepID=A0A5B7J8W9_PORTR|nr:hypothetical protein [Portunus trituberculatus]
MLCLVLFVLLVAVVTSGVHVILIHRLVVPLVNFLIDGIVDIFVTVSVIYEDLCDPLQFFMVIYP